ncbi:MAG: deoxyribose-phosphate aldolase [Thermoproteota archaeon]
MASWKRLLEIAGIRSIEDLSRRIDHALLKPWVSAQELERSVEELERLNLRCLILSPTLMRSAAGTTKGCLGAVVGFPFGYSTIEAKVKELEDVIGFGANEVDIVSNVQLYLLGNREEYLNEVRSLASICGEVGIKCKIIIEAPALASDQLEDVTRLVGSVTPPVSFIKTSTGYGPRPTHPEDVVAIDRTLRELGVRDKVGVKAAGGIRTAIQAVTMVASGADVIGTSTPRHILEQLDMLIKQL